MARGETQDEVLAALDEVAETAEATAMDARRLQTSVRTSRRLWVQGRSWRHRVSALLGRDRPAQRKG